MKILTESAMQDTGSVHKEGTQQFLHTLSQEEGKCEEGLCPQNPQGEILPRKDDGCGELSPQHRVRMQRDHSGREPEEGPPPPGRTLILDSPSSRKMRNESLLSVSHPGCGVLF